MNTLQILTQYHRRSKSVRWDYWVAWIEGNPARCGYGASENEALLDLQEYMEIEREETVQ